MKKLKETSNNFKELEKLNEYLLLKGIELHETVQNGIIYFINNKFYKYYIEGQYPSSLPSGVEGMYIECDCNGNTDYYNE